MKKLIACLALISVLLLVAQQPTVWELNETTRLQPILENEESSEFVGKNAAIIRSFKLYYRDSIYCTDSTEITFMSGLDTMQIYSIKRMSCTILAIFNVSHLEGLWLNNYPIDKLVIYNRVTDNYYTIITDDKEYFKKLFDKYNYTE
jgi:hypothetical protein